MGKIVKYCAKCEEGFAAKFGFCPNCGEGLQAFEMNPLNAEPKAENVQTEDIQTQSFQTESFETETLPPIKDPIAETAAFSDADVIELDSADVVEEKVYETAPAVETTRPDYFFDAETDVDDYSPTVIDEHKDAQLRNGLLISFACLVVSATMIAWVVSLFVHSLHVDALDDGALFAYVGPIEDKPMETEEQKKKDDDEGGGGGGGGKNEPRDPSKGRLVNQSENPINPPSANMPQLQNPILPYIQETQGNIKRDRTEERAGIPNSLYDDPSNGRGSGGGLGNGNGTGLGNGNGTGEGNGNGSGSGNGNGNGNGNGTGNGSGDPNDGPQLRAGVTSPVKILFKQQAKYTDAARQNNVQGTVTLRVTFTANGAIGAISPVSGLPYGLTEQAIAAARSIRFEPAKKNGVAITTQKTVAFSFTIY